MLEMIETMEARRDASPVSRYLMKNCCRDIELRVPGRTWSLQGHSRSLAPRREKLVQHILSLRRAELADRLMTDGTLGTLPGCEARHLVLPKRLIFGCLFVVLHHKSTVFVVMSRGEHLSSLCFRGI